MSFDIMLFDPERAPRDPAAFADWDYGDDDARAPRALLEDAQALLQRLFPSYDTLPEGGLEPGAEYALTSASLSISTSGSNGQALTHAVKEIAVAMGCGIRDYYLGDDGIWWPNSDADTTPREGYVLRNFVTGEFQNPSPALVEASVGWVGHTNPYSPQILILERDEQDYVQLLGGTSEVVVERRHWFDYDAFEYEHLAACQFEDDPRMVELDAGEEAREVRADEVLTKPQAADVFISFLERRHPESVAWHDKSEEMRAADRKYGSGPAPA